MGRYGGVALQCDSVSQQFALEIITCAKFRLPKLTLDDTEVGILVWGILFYLLFQIVIHE